jgi:tetratricopeptide (TPR) repeat protein
MRIALSWRGAVVLTALLLAAPEHVVAEKGHGGRGHGGGGGGGRAASSGHSSAHSSGGHSAPSARGMGGGAARSDGPSIGRSSPSSSARSHASGERPLVSSRSRDLSAPRDIAPRNSVPRDSARAVRARDLAGDSVRSAPRATHNPPRSLSDIAPPRNSLAAPADIARGGSERRGRESGRLATPRSAASRAPLGSERALRSADLHDHGNGTVHDHATGQFLHRHDTRTLHNHDTGDRVRVRSDGAVRSLTRTSERDRFRGADGRDGNRQRFDGHHDGDQHDWDHHRFDGHRDDFGRFRQRDRFSFLFAFGNPYYSPFYPFYNPFYAPAVYGAQFYGNYGPGYGYPGYGYGSFLPSWPYYEYDPYCDDLPGYGYVVNAPSYAYGGSSGAGGLGAAPVYSDAAPRAVEPPAVMDARSSASYGVARPAAPAGPDARGEPRELLAAAEPAADARSSQFAGAGEEAFQAGNYDEAARSWRHALLDDPTNGTLLMMYAQGLFARGQYDEAAGATQQAMRLLPEEQWGVVVKNYTELYSNTQDYVDQLRVLEAKVREQPDSASLRFLVGFHYGYLGYPADAVRELDKLAELAPQDQMGGRLRDQMAAKANLGRRLDERTARDQPADQDKTSAGSDARDVPPPK